MFGLFKRTKIEDWEIELLKSVLNKMPNEYLKLIDQINEGLLKGVLISKKNTNGLINFTFNSKILQKFDQENEKDFKLTNIRVYDKKLDKYLDYEIYILSGTISAYYLNIFSKPNIDFNKIDISNFRKVLIGGIEFKDIEHIFDENEKLLINPSNFYSVNINDKKYFHIKNLEDGDFIGIDENKVVYKITHDPLEVIMLSKNINEIFNES